MTIPIVFIVTPCHCPQSEAQSYCNGNEQGLVGAAGGGPSMPPTPLTSPTAASAQAASGWLNMVEMGGAITCVTDSFPLPSFTVWQAYSTSAPRAPDRRRAQRRNCTSIRLSEAALWLSHNPFAS